MLVGSRGVRADGLEGCTCWWARRVGSKGATSGWALLHERCTSGHGRLEQLVEMGQATAAASRQTGKGDMPLLGRGAGNRCGEQAEWVRRLQLDKILRLCLMAPPRRLTLHTPVTLRLKVANGSCHSWAD